jgi:hypothetical protein
VSKRLREVTTAGRRATSSSAIARAAKTVAGAKSALLAAGSVPDAADRCIDCAARLLAACADIWMIRGPAAGPRGDALLQALAEQVEKRARAVASGERPADVERVEVTAAAAAAVDALRDIARRSGDTADALERLEHSFVALAALAIRMTQNEKGSEPQAALAATAVSRLRGLVEEISLHAEAVANDADGDAHLARPLAEALRLQPSWFAIETLESGEWSGPRIDALLELRAMWLALAARELLIVRWLDGLVDAPAYARFASLEEALTEGSGNVLVATGLATRPEAFDAGLAYAHQFDALTQAVEALCHGLSGDRAAAGRAQQIVLTRLLRAVAAVWVTDAQLDARP